MDESKALHLRIQRERAARTEAEFLLEAKSKELHSAVQESGRLAEELKKTVELQTQELLSAQRVTKLGTFVWDLEENEFSWSEGGCELLGLDCDGTTNTFEQLLAVLHPKDRDLMQRLLESFRHPIENSDALASDGETIFRVLLPDQEVHWIKFVCEQVGAMAVSGAVLDITDSVLAANEVSQARVELEQRLADLEATQEELKIANEQANAANATKSRFIAMISHEIRTPINGLLGTLTLLSDSQLDDSQKELLGVATSSAESLRVLVNDVIDFARLETGQIQLELTDFDIRQLVSQLVDLWGPLASASGNELETKIDSGVPRVLRGDATRIGQILTNLLSNAVKFTQNGTITVRIRQDETRGRTPSKSHLLIDVCDTGVGIDKDNQADLFKDFSQIKVQTKETQRVWERADPSSGAGLGLAICRTLLEQMDGKISVMSSPGIGSTFSISLALATVSDTISKESSIQIRPLVTLDGNAPYALVADDVPANQLVSRMLLQSFGCKVDIVNDGLEAVVACKQRKYDFVLMDVSMPRLDGVAATKQIRSLEQPGRQTLPIIGLTAYAFTHETDEFLEAGMDEVICKPVHRETLYETVKAAVRGELSPMGDQASQDETSAITLDVLQTLTSGLSHAQILKVMEQISSDLDKYRRDAIADAKHGNVLGLARSCHAVKGLAASFGSQDLASLASQIENSARSGDSELAFATTLDKLDTATDEALKAYSRLAENPLALTNAS